MNEDGPTYLYVLMALAVFGTLVWAVLHAMGLV